MVSNSRGGVTQQKMVPPTVVSIMVSTSTTFVLSKRRLNRKSVFTRRNEAFDKNPFPLAGKTTLSVRN